MAGDDTTRVTYDVRIDAYSPPEMASRVQTAGVTKSGLDFLSTFTLAILAGAFIGMGAELATIVATDTQMGYGPTRLGMGLAFSLGLILVVVAGAELFTGNTLIVMAWAGGKVSTFRLLRNWAIVYVGNFVGSVLTVLLVYYGRVWTFGGGKVGVTALSIANAKSSLTWEQAIALGILCNALVCIAVWLCFSARSNTDKVLSIIFPITAFVASGFEHSVANMYFIPMGLLLKGEPSVIQAAAAGGLTDLHNLTWAGFLLNNLVPVTIGNIIGGAVLVGGIYWLVYLRAAERPKPSLAPSPRVGNRGATNNGRR
jgi:formate transporter